MPKKEGDEIISWIESQPELDYIRLAANKTLCDYRKDQTELSDRIIVNSREDSSLGKESTIKKILNIIWVPGNKLRGNQVASKELDNSLTTSAKVMSVSTIWDFACTLPIFTYVLSPLARGFAGPAGFILGFIILWASNITGENSTNRTLNNTSKARASLIAFLVLSLAKTAVSGVGIDMVISKGRIIEGFAEEKVLEKSEDETKKIDLALSTKVTDPSISSELKFARDECLEYTEQLKSLDLNKGKQRKLYREINELKKVPCSKAASLGNIESSEKGKQLLKINLERQKAQKQVADRANLSSIGYLLRYYPGVYDTYFDGVPPSWVRTFKDKNIIDKSPIDWRDDRKGDAVEASMKQFFGKLEAGELASLGFSIFAFVVSVILTLTASILLYTTGKNSEVKASFTSGLGKKSNALLSGYRDDLDEDK